MDSSKHNKWDIIIKIGTTLVSIVALLLGMIYYFDEQKNIKELEYQKIQRNDSLRTEQRLLEKKVEIYIEVSTSIGELLSVDKKSSNFNELVYNFEKLYYGKAIIVEDSTINLLMKHFKFSIEDYAKGYIGRNQFKLIGMNLVKKLKSGVHKKTIYGDPN